MTHHDGDICIIGGGSDGLGLAAGVAQIDAKDGIQKRQRDLL